MSYRERILDRLKLVEAELVSLTSMMEREGSGTPAPAPEAATATGAVDAPVRTKPPRRVPRLSYAATSVYALSGENPFRAGSNWHAIFAHLREVHGRLPFTRAQLGQAIAALRTDGAIDSAQDEQALVVQFVQVAGGRGRLQMVNVEKVAPAKPR